MSMAFSSVSSVRRGEGLSALSSFTHLIVLPMPHKDDVPCDALRPLDRFGRAPIPVLIPEGGFELRYEPLGGREVVEGVYSCRTGWGAVRLGDRGFPR